VAESIATVGGVKVTPAVRALARKLKVNLSNVKPSGKDGVVTRADVEEAARNPQQAEPAPAPKAPPKPAAPPRAPAAEPRRQALPSGEWEPIRGTRRTMARIMSESHRQVVATSIMDDADIQAWAYGQDITVRLLRSLWAGARMEPGLNAWYDGEQNVRMLHKGMDVGMAVDTEDGLFVAALRNVHSSSAADMRSAINRLRDNVINRSIPAEDLKDYTIMLSNFGVFAGRYATPIIAPPCVAIIAAGKLRNEVVPVLGGFEVHRVIPLSLTFDHRAVTGGEAARFLKAMLEDLALPE
jgi:pyruvate dehydrogenase E2 component (dihydrolipoamide acetyltransferase)